MEEIWSQVETIHCPDNKCKGMLLTHPYYHEHKCSDCKKYWMSDIRWIEYKFHTRVMKSEIELGDRDGRL